MTLEQAKAEYERVSPLCGVFDKETIQLQRERDKAQRDWVMARKAERNRMLAHKGAVYFELLTLQKAADEAAKASEATLAAPVATALPAGPVPAPKPAPKPASPQRPSGRR